ncbi:hypothetical protein [Paracoccus beibuensis]|uniref:hypothetical protein n=1 Tax=Paracoccus beibuensis TaxID=547602 RepID=UPI00223F8A20|nr:hypothetical protein [Paracoccus beibuensis]
MQFEPATLTFGMWIGVSAAHAEPLSDRMQIDVSPYTPRSQGRKRSLSGRKTLKDCAAFNITTPDLMVYLPENPNCSAMLVTPSGLRACRLRKEADEVAPALDEAGTRCSDCFTGSSATGRPPMHQ